MLNEADGIKEAVLVCNNNMSKAFAFITTSKENRNDQTRRILKEKVSQDTQGEFKLSGIIFLDALPKVANGKVSRSLLHCLLNKLPHHIQVLDQNYIKEVEQ